jgi:acetylornithine deacetylase/succinyl-diaminopimelate desuccinylase-like protein
MLARLVAAVHDDNGRVRIPGFYDDVRDVEPWEKAAWEQLPGEAETLRLTGVPKLWGEAGYSDLERRWARPTAEVNGIGGGYQGEGSKTVIPRSAFAKFSFRLVPDQNPDDILAKVRSFFESAAPDAVRVEVKTGHSGKPYAMDPHSPFGKAAQRALTKTFARDSALIREGGSIPIVQSFKDILGVETLLLGLALPDCQIHAPNENFTLENYEAGIRLNQHLLEELAAA